MLPWSATQVAKVKLGMRAASASSVVDLDQVGVAGDAVDQMDRVVAVALSASWPSIDRNGASPVPPARNRTGRVMSRR